MDAASELHADIRGWRSCVVWTNEVIPAIWRSNNAMSSLCLSRL